MKYSQNREVFITIVNGKDTVKFDLNKGSKESDNDFNAKVMKCLSHFFPFWEIKYNKRGYSEQ